MIAVLVLLLGLLTSSASALTFRCTAGDVGCVIASIAKANLRPDLHHVLELDASTFTFTRQDNGDQVEGFTATPVLLGSLAIRGVSAAQTILERAQDAPLFRLLHVGEGGRLTLEGLTVQGGEVSPVFFNRGGGVLNEGALTVKDAVVRDNAAWIGGGIHSARGAPLHLVRSAIEHNTADFVAGGVTAAGETLIEDCLLAENLAERGGGLGFDPAGRVVVRRSIIAGNVASLVAGGGLEGVGELELVNTVLLDNASGLRGGALNLDDGTVLLQGVACVGNQAENFGGCLFVVAGTVTVRGSVITANHATPFGVGGGVFNSGGTVRLRNSVLAGNEARLSPDCFGTVVLQGASIVGDPTDCDVQR